jgi:hypothetical protein
MVRRSRALQDLPGRTVGRGARENLSPTRGHRAANRPLSGRSFQAAAAGVIRRSLAYDAGAAGGAARRAVNAIIIRPRRRVSHLSCRWFRRKTRLHECGSGAHSRLGWNRGHGRVHAGASRTFEGLTIPGDRVRRRRRQGRDAPGRCSARDAAWHGAAPRVARSQGMTATVGRAGSRARRSRFVGKSWPRSFTAVGMLRSAYNSCVKL